MKITGTSKDSVCVHCGSTSYGRSCPFGPKKTHCHTDDALKCIWCNSSNVGNGCPFNPFGTHHQRGYAVNTLALEAIESGVVRGIIMKKLSQPITEMRAYILGLIDEKGNKIKEPATVVERNALTTADLYLIKLKTLSEKNIDMINTTLYFENKSEEYSIDELKKMYPIELDCEKEIHEAVSKLVNVAKKYENAGMSGTKIEKLIAESIISVKNQPPTV